MNFISTKVMDGYSTCFRYHNSEDESQLLHGTDIKFKFYFEGDLDNRNWVVDFGIFKRTNHTIIQMQPKEFLSYLFDHTVLISEDDPYKEKFKELDKLGVIQLRIFPSTTPEGIKSYLFPFIDELVRKETGNRAYLKDLEVIL
jgi:6-pyruvoyltetrahydropterin/6-carboxytetrahydropterin synthase